MDPPFSQRLHLTIKIVKVNHPAEFPIRNVTYTRGQPGIAEQETILQILYFTKDFSIKGCSISKYLKPFLAHNVCSFYLPIDVYSFSRCRRLWQIYPRVRTHVLAYDGEVNPSYGHTHTKIKAPHGSNIEFKIYFK